MPDPRARAVAAILAIVGALLATSVQVLAVGWLIVILLCWRTKILRGHSKFLLGVMLPYAVLLFLIWVAFVGSPPGAKAIGHDRLGAVFYALTIVLRLAILGGITQLFFMTLTPEQTPATLAKCGIRGEGLIVALGTIALLPEIRHRSEQVLTARFALGAMPNRSFFVRAKEFPHMLRPLLAWSLRSAIERSENWHQRRIFSRMAIFSVDHTPISAAAGVFITGLSVLWVAAVIVLRCWGKLI